MKYDCIVIGAGISGIVTALLLQTYGKKVLLLEKESHPGGYFSGFENEVGDKFDYAISYVLSCGQGEVVDQFLSKVGLNDKIRFHKLNMTDDVYMKDKHICFGQGRENFRDTLCKEFPNSKDEIEKMMLWMVDYQEGIATQGDDAMKFFIANFKKNYEDFLNEYITDEELKGLLSLRIQADPASLMIMAGFIVECYFKGMYYPVGGSYKFVSDLIKDFESKGGELKTSVEICKFQSEDNKIKVAIDTEGNLYEASSYVFNGDVIKLNNRLLDGERKPATIKRLNGRVIGHSSLSIYIVAKDYNVEAFKGGRVYFTESEKVFDAYREVESGEIPKYPVIKLHFPCYYDDSLTDKNKQMIRIETDIYYDENNDTVDKYNEYAERILEIVDKKILTGISEKIEYKRIITPLEFAQMFGHTNGSGTGWAHTTMNMMLSKYPQNTEFNNLFIAGQWGEFGSGLRQLVLSGEKSAENVMKLLK